MSLAKIFSSGTSLLLSTDLNAWCRREVRTGAMSLLKAQYYVCNFIQACIHYYMYEALDTGRGHPPCLPPKRHNANYHVIWSRLRSFPEALNVCEGAEVLGYTKKSLISNNNELDNLQHS